LNAKKQALQKKEKDGRLADLMKFHQTFKLNVPVPPDLVPLLSKTKKSPDGSEGSPKEDNQPEQTPKPAVSESPAATVESAKPATTSSPAKDAAKPAAKPASTFKFNIKASEFKPNPSAPAFVPVRFLTC
jgi:hypothetical protein